MALRKEQGYAQLLYNHVCELSPLESFEYQDLGTPPPDQFRYKPYDHGYLHDLTHTLQDHYQNCA